jgi:hypothetical protein
VIEVGTPQWAERQSFVILYAVRNLLTDFDKDRRDQLLTEVRQAVGNPRTWQDGLATISYVQSCEALQVKGAWYIQKEVKSYPDQLRGLRRLPGGKIAKSN